MQRRAPIAAARVELLHEIGQRARRQQQLEGRPRALRLQRDFVRSARPLHGAGERADAQSDAVNRAEKPLSADRQGEKLRIAITAHPPQLAFRRNERDAGDVSHGRRAVRPRRVACNAFADGGHRRAHPEPRVARAQFSGDREPGCCRLHLEQAVNRIEAQDSVQASGVERSAHAHRLAKLQRGYRLGRRQHGILLR